MGESSPGIERILMSKHAQKRKQQQRRNRVMTLKVVGGLALVLVIGWMAFGRSAAPASTNESQNPAISAELRASDVALLSATGRPQLVEFFAFW